MAARLPSEPGVYRFRDAAGRVLYLGRAVSLRRRVGSYWGDVRDRVHLAPMVARIARVEAVVCDSAHEAAWLERNLLQRRLPPWNRSPSGGQESEVWIRVSRSASAPGVTVVLRPAPGDFGPYLGGQKARDAVSGLGHVLPLAHTAAGLSATERELARARGAAPAARAEFARAVAAVLNRDTAAVAWLRAELTARRDAAASALAFEFAARLQCELEALDWITAEQKVTRAHRRDLDLHGWADGVLVCFEVRGGRLCGWRQHPCSAAAARRYPACDPEWADFARRAAALAARLGLVSLREFLGDFPDMASGVGEAGGAHSPWPVHRAVQQRHTALRQLRACRVHIVHVDGELETRSGLAAGDGGRLDEPVGGGDLEQVNGGVPELEHGGVAVLEDHRHAEDILVERLGTRQILHEKDDYIHALQRHAHFHSSFGFRPPGPL
jgi:hypothetical protein